MRAWLAAALLVSALGSTAFASLSGQAPHLGGEISLTASHRAPVSVDPGAAVTLVYSLRNGSGDSIQFVPALSVPDGWSVALGQRGFAVGPREAELWIVSLSIPANAPAGLHVIRNGGSITSRRHYTLRADSAAVTVNLKRAVGLSVVDRPVYAISGDRYRLALMVVNHGNGPITVRVSGKSSLNNVVRFDPWEVFLRPGEAKTVNAWVSTEGAAGSALDDLVEVRAADTSDSTVASLTSATVTLVERPGSSKAFSTVPALLKVRAAARNTDISPYELTGAGRIDERREEQIDFLFRGRTASSAFGDRAKNRLEIRAPAYRARFGDNYFNLSPLTAGGQSGFGAGLDLKGQTISGGAYTQRFRFEPSSNSERGAYVRVGRESASFVPSLTLNAVDRSAGPFAGQVLSSALRLKPFSDMALESEYAVSKSDSGSGDARSFRVSGSAPISYDFSHVAGDSSFAGPTRSASSDYITLARNATESIELTAAASRTDFRVPVLGASSRQRFSTGAVGASYRRQVAIEYIAVKRDYQLEPGGADTLQHLIKVRVARALRYGTGWASVEAGRSIDSAAGRISRLILLGGNLSFGRTFLSGYGELYNGGSLSKGSVPAQTFGGTGSLTLTQSNTIAFFGHHTSYGSPVTRGYSQLDARFTHVLRSGATIGARVRISNAAQGAKPEKLAYLEYGLPFRLPTGRARTAGTVSGQVTDRESGRGLPGVLVRLGPKAAVTDRNGRATFAGLSPGEYRVSLANDASISNAVLTGQPVVRVDSLSRRGPSFSVAVSRASKARGAVRRFARARTSLGGAADSLVDAGPVSDVGIALLGPQETLYRTTGSDGTFAFDAIPAGTWTVVVQGEPPVGLRYERPRVQVTVAAGDEARLEFRLVPRQRPVEIIVGEMPANGATLPPAQRDHD